ncbi:ADP-ribosyl-[dinitrogen reductase] hydrolase [Aestuariirhabdus litorea]|uniref:ADP-ribosyl-[dinitrogen reductase] hydrolase n=1 Tax=Aestuariirhabdus litorea TaxID=2528527 RepID=A0A3P3VKJ2_9GAMM|nr:ADP-ribosyl-[dinitrogen reductase] hydrolase [Aestuariirhabdus litorea]RRJ82894.1 ADP-ribosyl-[dinitrogen reductase] hydrolase [Aestuariirhabdus litorea]RWW93053.1 ADP-ribosyl-[dinitrogen reductase] hydrolase [Endozoicomonadaceae bacterium GTF-13]
MTASGPNSGLSAPLSPSLAERVRGSYLGLAVGDALGATVEFMTPREIAHEHGVHRSIVGGGWLRLKPGQVTDDTTMALALGEALLQARAIDPGAIAEAFSAWMRAKPVDIGHTVRAGIARYRRTGDTCMPVEEMSAGNGACMRCLPLAIATLGLDEPRLRQASRLQAHITHNNALADAGTEAVMLMLQGLWRGETLLLQLKQQVQPLAQAYPAYGFRRRPCLNPTGFMGHTLRVVFEGLFDSENFEQCLVTVVNRGGDADTTGAIAGMLAGAAYGERDIPPRWLQALDPTIRQQCISQANRLLALAPFELAASP